MSSARLHGARFLSKERPGEDLAWDALRIAAANILLILCAQIAVPLTVTRGTETAARS
jgi:hypothetical protein